MRIAVYNVVTGEILREVVCPEPILQLETGEAFIATDADTSGKHVVGGALADRPVIDIPAEIAVAIGETITLDIPDGSDVTCQNMEGTADADGMEMQFDEPGEWLVKIRPPFPWMPHRIRVTSS